MALTWTGSFQDAWTDKEEEEESLATMRAPLQAEMPDAAFEDLQRQLHSAIMEVEEGHAREVALLRRARKSEAAEEALASQIADLEAEAFTCLTQVNKLLPPAPAPNHMEPGRKTSQMGDLIIRLQAAIEETAAWARRCQDLEEEAEVRRVREAALQSRAEMAEAAEEILVSQIAELEAEAFTHITRNPLLLAEQCVNATEPWTRNRVEELERRLAEAEQELQVVHAKLRQAEERSQWLEMRAAVHRVLEEEKEGMMKTENDAMLSVSVKDLAGVKLKLWNPASLALTSS